VQVGEPSRAALQHVGDLMQYARANPVGVVFTKVDPTSDVYYRYAGYNGRPRHVPDPRLPALPGFSSRGGSLADEVA
jgi:hypothetical protein